MRAAVYRLTMLTCFPAMGCFRLNKEIPITLLEPEVQGLTVSVNGATIPDPDGPFRWNWGDGTTETSWFPNKHAYEKPGFCHVTVEVRRDGKPETQDLYLRLAV